MKYIKPSIVSIKDEQLREYIASASTVCTGGYSLNCPRFDCSNSVSCDYVVGR